ncbi:MAG: hypothetical protein WCG04_05165, partial [Alphaproteobacteria bacterium]
MKTLNKLGDSILQILVSAGRPLSKREIARHLHIKGTTARVNLKGLLAELISHGKILHQRHLYLLPSTTSQSFTRGQFLPITITHIDEDGGIIGSTPKDKITLYLQTKRLHRHLVPGMQVLGKITSRDGESGTAEIIRLLEKPTRTIIGLFTKQAHGGGGLIIPCERKRQGPGGSLRLPPQEADKLNEGDVVVYTAARNGTIKIIERLDSKDDPRLFSRMAIHTHDI